MESKVLIATFVAVVARGSGRVLVFGALWLTALGLLYSPQEVAIRDKVQEEQKEHGG